MQSLLLAQGLLERQRAKRRRRHALSINRIERTNRVAQKHEVVRQPFRAFEAAQAIFRAAVRLDRSKRLGRANRVVDRGDRHTAREFEKSRLVTRRVIAPAANQRHQPTIAFDTEDKCAAFSFRRRRLHDGARPIAVEVIGNAIQTARISEVRVDDDLFRRFVTHLRQPTRRT